MLLCLDVFRFWIESCLSPRLVFDLLGSPSWHGGQSAPHYDGKLHWQRKLLYQVRSTGSLSWTPSPSYSCSLVLSRWSWCAPCGVIWTVTTRVRRRRSFRKKAAGSLCTASRPQRKYFELRLVRRVGLLLLAWTPSWLSGGRICAQLVSRPHPFSAMELLHHRCGQAHWHPRGWDPTTRVFCGCRKSWAKMATGFISFRILLIST